MKVWLEDSVPEDLMASIKESSTIYTTERQKLIIQNVYGQLVHERKEEFNNILKVQNNQETVKQ
jgi:hypothetical protein